MLKTCNVNCSVDGCFSRKGVNSNLSFHKFPLYLTGEETKGKLNRHKAWIKSLKHRKPVSKFSKVCSLHFMREDFILPDNPTKRRRLKRTAVPSLGISNQNLIDLRDDISMPSFAVRSEDSPTEKGKSKKTIEQCLNISNTDEVRDDLFVPSFSVKKEVIDDWEQFTIVENKVDLAEDMSSEILCWACANTSDYFYPVNSKICKSSKTVKDVIVLLVPQMESVLNNSDVICSICRETLMHCVMFIDKCLRVEADRKKKLSSQRHVIYLKDDNIIKSTEMVHDELFDDASNRKLKEEFTYVFVNDEVMDVSESGNDDGNDDISRIEASPTCKLKYNRLISTTKLSTEVANNFIDILASNEIETLDYSQTTEQSTGQKRVILLGSLFRCKKCGKYISTEGRYIVHMAMHDRRRPVQKKKIVKPRKMRKEVNLQCTTCSERFSSKEDFELHTKIHPPFVCEKCGKGFEKGSSLKAHNNVHNDPNSFICEICGKAYKSRCQLQQHKMLHGNVTFSCDKCPKIFKANYLLRNHQKLNHCEDKTKSWPCEVCGKKFRKPSNLKRHYSLMHVKDGPKKCDVCGQGFIRTDYLIRHKRRHLIFGKDIPEGQRYSPPGPHQCLICLRIFQKVENLKLHIRSHGTICRFGCKYCSRTFKNKYQWRRHEKLHEENELLVKYRCGICWKRFESQEELDQHSLNHNNLKYKCDICEEYFARKHLLHDHIVNNHVEQGEAEEEMRKLLSAGLGTLYKNK